ncbi:hypothetical protein D3C81_1076800 [compost metagenome]
MAAGDGQVGRMQQEVARARFRHEAVAAHGLGREGRLRRLAVGRGRQGQGVRQPRFVGQQAVGIVKNFQIASGGARQQRRQRGRLQDLEQVGSQFGSGQGEGQDEGKLIHPEIVGDCGGGREGACIFRPRMATPLALGMRKKIIKILLILLEINLLLKIYWI